MKFFLPLALVCTFVVCSVAQDPLRDKVLCIIETKLSSSMCKSTSRAQALAGNDPASACAQLETFRGLLPIVGCSDDDYKALHEVVCEHKDVPCTLPGK